MRLKGSFELRRFEIIDHGAVVEDLNVQFEPASAWEKVVAISPQPKSCILVPMVYPGT
jgi:hypothetical protein